MPPGSLGKPSSMNTRSRMKAQEATPHNAPMQTKAIASSPPKELAEGKKTSGTVKAGLRPMRMRPSKVAAPVATTTGKNVRLETSGSRISIANKTPPSGVLKVAAMPAPAPAESRVILCPVERPIAFENADPSAEPIWMIGPSRPTDAPEPIERGERLDDRDDAANLTALVVDGVHYLGDAVTPGLRGEAIHQIDDNEAAQDRRKNNPVSPPARPLEDVRVIADLEHAVDHGVVDEADQRPERHRAHAGHDTDGQSHKAEDEQAYAPLVAVASGDGLGRNASIGSR